MASLPRHLRIFLASPGDVVDEREISLAVLDDLPYDPLLRDKVTIEAVAWDKRGAGAPILAGLTPQDSIAAGLPRPSDCDIVVVVFWSRMGTPLPAQYRKEDGSRYESGTEWEYDEAVTAFHEHHSPYVLLYRRKQPVLLNLDAPDGDDRREQYDKVKRFFASLRNADGSAAGGYTEYEPGDFRARLERDLKSLIARILEKPAKQTAAGVAAPPPWPGSPFPGLRAFTAADAPIFFGREREIDALIARVTDRPFVAVVGASGSGKSSLVAAGVIPRLQLTAGSTGSPQWLIVQFTPDRLGTGDPFASLAAAILHAIPETQQKGLAAQLREDPELVTRLLPRRTLVFIDQFEELFTTIGPSVRAPFVEVLQQLARAVDVCIIITVRADFYGHCVEMQTLARMIENSTFPLSAPGVAALYDMITRPAARAALTFEEGLAQHILDDTGQQAGALALMAYTLDELYRRGLAHAAYEELGGVQGAIGTRSESVFSTLGKDEKAALPRVFRELVEVDERGTATRQRAPLSRVAATPAAQRLTNALTAARLLVQSRGENNEPVVEVAHEALFRSWSRLADWIRDASDDLRLLRQVRTAAVEWDRNGRREDFLWSHERLAPVYVLRDRMAVEFDDTVAEFIRPEYERLAERIRTEHREFRQRSYVERLVEIGPPAAGALVRSLGYVAAEAPQQDILAALAKLGPAALPALVDACHAEQFNHRERVVEALVWMEASPGSAALERLLEDETSAVCVAAIHLVVASSDVEAVSLLARCINDRRSTIRNLAMLALATFDDDQAFEVLGSTLSDNANWHALRIVEYLLFRDRPEGDFLSTVLESFWDTGEYLLAQIGKNNLRRVEALAYAVMPILEHVEHPSFKPAVKVLIGSSTVTALRAVLNATGTYCRSYALKTIKRSASPRMMPALLELLEASEVHIREGAARVVQQLFGYGNHRPELARALCGRDGASRLLRLANNGHTGVSLAALSALSAMREITARQTFREHLASPNDRIRRVAVQGLKRISDSSAVPELIAALRDQDKGVQNSAATALAMFGAEKEAADEALAILESIASSPDDGEFKSALIHLALASPCATLTNVLMRIRDSESHQASRTARRKLKEAVA